MVWYKKSEDGNRSIFSLILYTVLSMKTRYLRSIDEQWMGEEREEDGYLSKIYFGPREPLRQKLWVDKNVEFAPK